MRPERLALPAWLLLLAILELCPAHAHNLYSVCSPDPFSIGAPAWNCNFTLDAPPSSKALSNSVFTSSQSAVTLPASTLVFPASSIPSLNPSAPVLLNSQLQFDTAASPPLPDLAVSATQAFSWLTISCQYLAFYLASAAKAFVGKFLLVTILKLTLRLAAHSLIMVSKPAAEYKTMSRIRHLHVDGLTIEQSPFNDIQTYGCCDRLSISTCLFRCLDRKHHPLVAVGKFHVAPRRKINTGHLSFNT